MFAIENCYRIIFEAMLEDSIFMCIAERIEEYTKAGVAFAAGTGKVLACSCMCEKLFPVSAGKGHLTFKDYMAVCDRKEVDGSRVCVTPVYGGKMAIGFVILVFGEKEEEAAFYELGGILAQNMKRYFEEEQKQYLFCQPLKEHMSGWVLFEEDASGIFKEYGFPLGNYLVVLFCKDDGHVQEKVAALRAVWNCLYIYEKSREVYVLLYHLKEKDAFSVYGAMEAEKCGCCVSEVFSDICLCREKKKILQRMARVKDSRETAVVRREKEWSMRGMYTYTASLIEKAGLRDYSVERLLLEDERNHTELYHTLKTYLLCENNVTAAAKRLHIHRNTLVYRLKQIKECIDVDMNDFEVSRELLAFIMMYDIAGKRLRS